MTHDLIDTPTSSMPELTKLKFNDMLGTYQSMLKQHNLSIGDAGRDQEDRDHEMEEDTLAGGKQGASSGVPDVTGKRQKQDDMEFPWIVMHLSDIQLEGSPGKTFKLLMISA